MKRLFVAVAPLALMVAMSDPVLAARGSTSVCSGSALPGAEVLWTKRDTRWIVVGEQHGTTETPAAFGDLVCSATKAKPKRRIVVALEYAQSERRAFDRYFASLGRATDRAALLRSTPWQSRFNDGRGSGAMLALVDRLRRLKQAGAVAQVVLFKPSDGHGAGPAEYEAAMALNLRTAATASNTLVLALGGNIHAMRTEFVRPNRRYLPAAGHLPVASTISLDARGNGGAAWNCAPDCGPHDRGPSRIQAARGVVLDAALKPAYDGLLNLGVSTTASPPAQAS